MALMCSRTIRNFNRTSYGWKNVVSLHCRQAQVEAGLQLAQWNCVQMDIANRKNVGASLIQYFHTQCALRSIRASYNDSGPPLMTEPKKESSDTSDIAKDELESGARECSSINDSSDTVEQKQRASIDKVTVRCGRVPLDESFEIAESDIREQFQRGHGPGGQKVNKTNNCVVLTHLPTGVTVRCHETRSQSKNRELARQTLRQRVAEVLFGVDPEALKEIRKIRKRKVDRKRKTEKTKALVDVLQSKAVN